jgi:hypothetical protein
MGAPREGLGALFRALLDFVDERRVRQQVYAAVSLETRALIDRPPRPLAFVPSRPIDEIEDALQKIGGPEMCVACGLACARPLGWTLLQPVLRFVFQMLGQSPEPIFSNLDRFFSLITRGISFEWNRTGKSGTVTARFEGPDLPEAPLHVLRGSLQFAFEVTTTTGSVSAPEIVEATPERTTALYRVEWR